MSEITEQRIVSELVTSHGARWCAGCGKYLAPGVQYLTHTIEGLSMGLPLCECLSCAARNGRPGYAEPDVAEQPLDLEGIA